MLAEVREWIDDRSIKREIVRAIWPAEWRDHFLPALSDRREALWCSTFISLGQAVMNIDLDLDLLEVSVREEARRSGFEIASADPLLAVYLAEEPALTGFGANDACQDRGELRETLPATLKPPNLADVMSSFGDKPADSGSSLDALLTQLDIAAARDDFDSIKSAVAEIMLLIAASPLPLDARIGPLLGNAALRCDERGLTREALGLHLAALEAAPNHANVAQNFVRFVIEEALVQLYGFAETILVRLETEDAMRDWKPLNTKVMRLEYDALVGRPAEATALEELLASGDALSRSQLVSLLRVASALESFDLMPRIAVRDTRSRTRHVEGQGRHNSNVGGQHVAQRSHGRRGLRYYAPTIPHS